MGMDNNFTIRITIRILDMIFSHKLLTKLEKKIVINLNVSYIFLQSSPYIEVCFLV